MDPLKFSRSIRYFVNLDRICNSFDLVLVANLKKFELVGTFDFERLKNTFCDHTVSVISLTSHAT